MSKSKYTTILQTNDIEEDGEVSEETRLGAVVQRGGSNDFELKNSSDKESLIVVNAADLNKVSLDDWTDNRTKVPAGETVTTKQFETGDRFDVWLDDGENVSKNDKLIPSKNYNGAFQKINGINYLPTSYSYTIADQNAPEGNPLYVEVDSDGSAYFESNLANVAADVYITFSDGSTFQIRHNGTPTGTQVYLDEDAKDGLKLVSNITGEEDRDVHVKAVDSDEYIQVVNDGSASSNGVALNYDDATDNRLEAETNNNSDVDIYSMLQIKPNEVSLVAYEGLNNTSGDPSRIEAKVKKG